MDEKGLIIIHPGHHGSLCFDIFGKLPKGWSNQGYPMPECPHVKSSGRSDYRYSEDLAHIPEFNSSVVEDIQELAKKGFIIKLAGWEELHEQDVKGK